MKKFFKIFGLFLLFQIIYIPLLSIVLVYYGPFTSTRDMIVTTAMTTMTHQYFATLFLSQEKIDAILAANRPDDVSTKNFKGYLLIVNDPSRVKLVSAPKIGKVGSTTSQIVEAYDAVGGINAGGFEDDALGTGGKPAGLVIENGEITFGSKTATYSVVGMDNNNKLVVSNYTNYTKLKSLNIKSAVSFGPVIIINGKPTIGSGSDGGWGIQPRTAIAQRKDGAILMLVIDGRQAGSIGATLKNVQDILLNYGAYNAFNLDGGASTTMVFNEKVINTPSDIMGERYVPNAFIITKPSVDSGKNSTSNNGASNSESN